MTVDDLDAIRLLRRLLGDVRPLVEMHEKFWSVGEVKLAHAIRHLAYPDRDIYPKTRRGTKGAPIVRRQRAVDDLR